MAPPPAAASENGVALYVVLTSGVISQQLSNEVGEAEGRSTGPDMAGRFALLWPRAVQARSRRPAPLRRIKIDLGMPGVVSVPFSYLFDIIHNRDLWMHRVDLAGTTRRPFVIGHHGQHIVAQSIRELAVGRSAAPVALVLTGIRQATIPF